MKLVGKVLKYILFALLAAVIVIGVYLLVNAALMAVLGVAGMAASTAVAPWGINHVLTSFSPAVKHNICWEASMMRRIS